MRILVASGGHKHVLTSREACGVIVEALAAEIPDARFDPCPVGDGGEGTTEALVQHHGGGLLDVAVHDPLGRPVTAKIGIYGPEGATAVMEMAEAGGSALLLPHERRTMTCSSHGVGEMLQAAMDNGCRKLLLGLGGSICSDMGVGLAQSLGVRFFDRSGRDLTTGPAMTAEELLDIWSVDVAQSRLDMRKTHCVVVSDADIPLLGPRGQARMFGPQKGCSPEQIAWLEEAFSHMADRIKVELGREVDLPYAGAAGGMGAGMTGFFGAELMPGMQAVGREIGLEQRVAEADVVLVGEGRCDETTFLHKGPHALLEMAHAHGKPVVAVVGVSAGARCEDAFDAIFVSADSDSGEPCREHAVSGLKKAAGRAARHIADKR